ncbi:DUF1707 SHOCT-like domain-containing protein [Aeromicrobium chenweiae]|uniref:Uncharacterized protein n=1 Tax=Aeromicrobium chenweiae TaxID=2079793 RepID=A0A2S0WKZ5_9ACTN|nr:DUF1707 domain-containing protein [Aeromicrobium chenweiae]AWB92018.1 hypothetical protein C3E78_07285 [Aeromicrobium chenweiae]TGN32868.1 DUF1707 domain-containing protein [Aeromicrobium chenweiae]
MPAADVWSAFSADPRAAASADLKASDTDRDVAAAALREAYADGRLTRGEYDERSTAALAVRSMAGFLPLLTDLVPSAPVPATGVSADLRAQAVVRYQRDLRDARNGWLFVSGLCTAIWGATSVAAGDPLFFWPVFPSLGVGIGYVATRLNAESRIEAIEDKIAETRRVRRAREDELGD